MTCPEPTVPRIMATGLIDRFHDRYPDLRVEFVTSDSYLDLNAGDTDVAFRSGEAVDETLVGQKICNSVWPIYASRTYVQKHGRPASVADLAAHDMIGFERIMQGHRVATWLPVAVPEARIVSRCNSMLGTAAAVRSGVGIAPLPTTLGDAEDELVQVLPAVSELTRDWFIPTSANLRKSPKVAAFVDHCSLTSRRFARHSSANPAAAECLFSNGAPGCQMLFYGMCVCLESDVYIKTIEPADATGEIAALYEAEKVSMGCVMEATQCWSARPDIIVPVEALLHQIRDNFSLDLVDFRLVTFVAARFVPSSYCCHIYFKALSGMLGRETALAIHRDYRNAGLSEQQIEMLAYAEKITRNASSISAHDIERLRSVGFSDLNIADIALAASFRNFLSRYFDAVGATVEETFLDEDVGIRAELAVGRT